MKILFVRPYRRMHKVYAGAGLPLNLMTLASYVRKFGHEAAIKDFHVEHFHTGAFMSYLDRERPDVVGFSCFTPDVKSVEHMSGCVKTYNKSTVTLAGGTQPTAEPARTLTALPSVDYLILGEAEIALRDLLNSLRAGKTADIPSGVFYRGADAGAARNSPFIEDLDDIPSASMDLLDLSLYKGQPFIGYDRASLRIGEMISSRGCPSRCIFCCSNIVSGRKTRYRSEGHVLGEAELYRTKYGIRHIGFYDDTFTINRNRLSGIMKGLYRIGLTWNCATRADSVSAELLKDMVAKGCTGIYFGVESGSERVLDLIRKGQRIGQITSAIGWAHDAGVKNITVSVMIGNHPTETPEEVRETFELVRKLRPTYLQINIMTPFPGTRIHQEMQSAGLLDKDITYEDFSYIHDSAPKWRTLHFSSERLLGLQRGYYKKFYLNPGFILKKALSLRSLRDLAVSAGYARSFIGDMSKKTAQKAD